MCPHIQNTIDKLMYAVQVSVNQIYSNKRLFLVPQNQNTKGRTFVLKLTKPHIVAYRTLSQVRPRGVDYVTAVHWNTVDLNSDPPLWKRPCCMWTDGTRTHTHTQCYLCMNYSLWSNAMCLGATSGPRFLRDKTIFKKTHHRRHDQIFSNSNWFK